MRLLHVTLRQAVASVVLSACIGLLGGASAAWAIYRRLGPASASSSINTGSSNTPGSGSALNIDAITAASGPSVVKVVTQPLAAAGLAADPAGVASGVAVSADGLVVTSTHALRGATKLEVATADGRLYEAIVAATDAPHGIAILRAVEATDLHPLRFAAAAPRPGDAAIVLGSPPFASVSVTSGTVSSTGRSATEDSPVGAGQAATLLDVMTADAFPESSGDGGPVLDGAGTIIGVVSGGAHRGLAGMVALSGRDAAALVDRAMRGSAAVHPTFGAETVWLDPATAAATGLVPGALVRAVDPAGPSASALQVGDVVTAVNGTPVDDRRPFDPSGFGEDAGQPVTVSVNRGGRSVSVTVTVAAR